MLAEDARLPVRASLDMYASILDKIEQNEYDNFNKRAYTSKLEKIAMLPMAKDRAVSSKDAKGLTTQTLPVVGGGVCPHWDDPLEYNTKLTLNLLRRDRNVAGRHPYHVDRCHPSRMACGRVAQ